MTESKAEVDIAEEIRKILKKEIKLREQRRILERKYPYENDPSEHERLLCDLYMMFEESRLPLDKYRMEPDSHYIGEVRENFEELKQEVEKWKEGEKQSPLSHFILDERNHWG